MPSTFVPDGILNFPEGQGRAGRKGYTGKSMCSGGRVKEEGRERERERERKRETSAGRNGKEGTCDDSTQQMLGACLICQCSISSAFQGHLSSRV
jgi:hypothetical protein